jgi:hypothetical protein
MVMLELRTADCALRICRQRIFFVILTALATIVLSVSSLNAQEVQATARVDSNNIVIGDWLKLHVEIRHPENVNVQFPSIPDSLQGFEIVKRDSPTQQKTNQQVLESTTYTLTAFDTGTYVVPPLLFQYTFAGDSTRHTAETSPIPVFVHGVGVDTSKEIKDIKPPLSISISFAELLPYILGVIGVAAAAWLIYYIIKKRRKGEALLPEAPPRPAHEVALEALRSLEAEKLWQRGLVKEYHSQVTDIIRTYIEKRYAVLAMEMITDEILSTPAIVALDKSTKEQLREMLVLADLVKFAKFQPLAEEHERSLRSAFSFVESTQPRSLEHVKQETAQEVAA